MSLTLGYVQKTNSRDTLARRQSGLPHDEALDRRDDGHQQRHDHDIARCRGLQPAHGEIGLEAIVQGESDERHAGRGDQAGDQGESGNRLPRLGAAADLCLQSLPLLSQGFASRNFRLGGPQCFRHCWVLFWQRHLVHSNSWQRWPNLGGQYRGALDRLRYHWTGCRLIFGHTEEPVPSYFVQHVTTPLTRWKVTGALFRYRRGYSPAL